MSRLSAWARSARPLAHANIAPPIVLGQALAFAESGWFSWRSALLVHAIGAVDHLAIVWANDLADEAGDREHDAPTPFSGGSRVLVEGSLSRASLRRAAALAIATLLALGVLGAATGAPLLLPLVLAALVLLWLYSGPPLRSHRGGGEWLQALGVGVVLPLLGAAAQGMVLAPSVLVPPFVLAVGGHWVTAIPDEHADRRAHKSTLAVRWGGLAARRAALVAIAIAAASGAMLLPGPRLGHLAVLAAVLTALVPAVVVHRDAGPDRRARCLRFVVSAGAAAALAQLGWAIVAVT